MKNLLCAVEGTALEWPYFIFCSIKVGKCREPRRHGEHEVTQEIFAGEEKIRALAALSLIRPATLPPWFNTVSLIPPKSITFAALYK